MLEVDSILVVGPTSTSACQAESPRLSLLVHQLLAMIPSIRPSSTFTALLILIVAAPCALATQSHQNLDRCPGYNAQNVQVSDRELTADLYLAGDPCKAYGEELHKLSLRVQYQTGQFASTARWL